jgi:hypothetical protein
VGTLTLNSITSSSKSLLAVFGVCFVLVGISSYVDHNKKYLKIKYLKNKDIPVLASWTFKPNTSDYINTALYNKKFATISTALLTCVLCLVMACCIYLSGEKYSTPIASLLMCISLIVTIAALMLISYYYDSKLSSDSEALIGEDCFYFIDDLHTLQKSIYFLQDVRIDYSSEVSLQFLYGDYDLFKGPSYTINIPIPKGELLAAELIQKHYLELIHYE